MNIVTFDFMRLCPLALNLLLFSLGYSSLAMKRKHRAHHFFAFFDKDVKSGVFFYLKTVIKYI